MAQSYELKKHFFISVILHIIILSALIVSFEFHAPNYVIQNSDKNIVNAIIVNESKLDMPNPSPLPPPKAHEKPVVKPTVKPSPSTVKSVPHEIKKDILAIPDPHKKQIQQELLEKQLLADLKKQTDKKKKSKHKELVKAFEKELKATAASSLQNELLTEKNRASSAQANKMQGIVNKYKALILQSIGQHWLVPNGVDKSLSTQLLIRLTPSGVVLDVQLVKSSGDDALDRSARTAVFKASPLPVPTAADEFAPFKEFILKVKPENIIARDNGLN